MKHCFAACEAMLRMEYTIAALLVPNVFDVLVLPFPSFMTERIGYSPDFLTNGMNVLRNVYVFFVKLLVLANIYYLCIR